jgi:hypothetical protein
MRRLSAVIGFVFILSAVIFGDGLSSGSFWTSAGDSLHAKKVKCDTLVYTVAITPPAAPTLTSPTNGATASHDTLTLKWGTVSGAITYAVQVSTSTTFIPLNSNYLWGYFPTATTGTQAIYTSGATYYWEVNSYNEANTSAWSAVWSFTAP